uniref:Transmembrane protein n=1 Tax=Rodentolepis nana TaxID=102285 RepID=A0A0R3TWN9_RODNA
LIISGLCFCILVISYNPFKFCKAIVNDFGINDWKLPKFFVFIIAGLVPLEAIGLIIWWTYSNIASTRWYELAAESLASTFLEWSILLATILVFNFIAYRLKCTVVKSSTEVGYDPHNLSEVPPAEAYKLVREITLYSQATLDIGVDLSNDSNKCHTTRDNLRLKQCE